MRIDKWLWFARLAKSRSLAARLCAAGAVTLDGVSVVKPHQQVAVGSLIRVPRGRMLHEVRVLALGQRRGPASEACLLYMAVAPPQPLQSTDSPWESLFGEEQAEEGG